jgi:hypothetical protein
MVTLDNGDPAAVELGVAIRAGDLRSLRRLLGSDDVEVADALLDAGRHRVRRGLDRGRHADQHTPLDMARGSGAEDLVESLLTRGARSAGQPR